MGVTLDGMTAVVTGGSKGYGAGIAGVLRRSGAEVWITGRDSVALDNTAEQIAVHGITADVTNGADWDRLIQEVLGATGRLDVLVNNAGSAVSIKPLEDQSDGDMTQSIVAHICSLPSHLEVLEYAVLPLVQEIVPL